MKQRGFTVIELLVVIIIMAILLVLAVVNVRSTQVQARDAERHTDTENIATVLESFYNTTHNDQWRGTYPGTSDMAGPYVSEYLTSNLGQGSERAPGVGSEDPSSIVMATNNDQSLLGVRPIPTLTTYVYQPLDPTNILCPAYATSNGCIKFNIFYKLERPTDECPAPDNICVVRSKHQ